jgi:hypothetical protein
MIRLTAEPDAVRRGRSSRVLTAAAAGLILVFGLGACSSSGSPSSTASGSSSPAAGSSTGQTHSVGDSAGITFHGSIQVTGATRLAATFTDYDTAVSTCAAAAAHGDLARGVFEVPTSTPHVTAKPQIHIQVADFHGVGTYAPTVMQKDTADWISLKVSGATSKYELTSHPATPVKGQTTGKAVLFLNKDGSGQVAFSEAHKLGKKSGPAIAGLISWKCSN